MGITKPKQNIPTLRNRTLWPKLRKGEGEVGRIGKFGEDVWRRPATSANAFRTGETQTAKEERNGSKAGPRGWPKHKKNCGGQKIKAAKRYKLTAKWVGEEKGSRRPTE